MGELVDYYIIQSVVEYDNDPLCIGRIKCTIPGVIHSDTTDEEAMPWVRCFKMGAYQTFSRPIVGQKVWVLISKTNYNEFWWFPFYENIDICQQYLEEYYDYQPDIFHARHTGNGDAMSTYDDKQGYLTKIGDDHINLRPNKELELDCQDCRMCIKSNKVYLGDKDEGKHEPAIMGNKCWEMRGNLKGLFKKLDDICKGKPYISPLSPWFEKIANELTNDKLQAEYTLVD